MERYSAKAIFEMRHVFRDARPDWVFYEVRIVCVTARDEASALRKLQRFCGDDQWTYSGQELKLQRQKFLGFADFKDLATLQPGGEAEVWYEYVDEKPHVERFIRPPKRGQKSKVLDKLFAQKVERRRPPSEVSKRSARAQPPTNHGRSG